MTGSPTSSSSGNNTISGLSNTISGVLSYLIPASLYVTLEIQRVVNSMFIIWDQDLGAEYPAMVNCSDLNEELGQINVLFTDKTGTLTENVMEFKAASIAGSLYSVEELRVRRRPRCSYTDVARRTGDQVARRTGDEVDARDEKQFTERQEKKIHQFLMALCLCHSGQVRRNLDDFDDLDYPDGSVLLWSCKKSS